MSFWYLIMWKKTLKIHAFWECSVSPYREFFMRFSVFIPNKLLIHISRNVFSFLQTWYFPCILAFFYLPRSEILKILVFGNAFLFLHKSYFACILAFYYANSSKTLKRDVFGCYFIFPHTVIFMVFSVLVPSTQKTRSWKSPLLSTYKVLCLYFCVLLPNNVEYTQITCFW